MVAGGGASVVYSATVAASLARLADSIFALVQVPMQISKPRLAKTVLELQTKLGDSLVPSRAYSPSHTPQRLSKSRILRLSLEDSLNSFKLLSKDQTPRS